MKKLFTLTVLTLLCHFASFGQCTISGTLNVCVGSTGHVTIDSMLCTGTFTSSATSIAIVDSIGDVTGVSAGTTTITYFPSTGGSSTETVIVSPSPAPITGTTTFCSGTTSALADATSGGTWSSSYTWVATVGASTGVVTGVNGGGAYISYTLGSCSATAYITIETIFGTDSLVDSSIAGPTSVCSGSSITLSCFSTGGGTWSSSATSVATVGSATGIVTGITTGVTNISYSVTNACGTGSIFHTVTVNPLVTTASIAGLLTTVVGGTTTLSSLSEFGTNYWTSVDPSIGTISGSGVVTGVAPGTDSIKLVVIGCINSDSGYAVVTVSALDGISGYVNFSGTGYYGDVTVWLITFNTATLDLEAIDSTTLYCSGSSVYYSFTGSATDSYRVKAALTYDSIGTTTSFIPTYHDSSYHWNTATVIYHTAGTSDINENIDMNTGTATSGPGFISGSVLTGAGKHTSGGAPVVGLLVYVVDQTTGVELQRTYTNASGNYSFSNLPVGATYLIYPESMNYTTTVYSSITLTSGSPSMTAADFLQHNTAKTITPIPAGVNNITPSLSTVGVFPNPSNGKINLYWNETASENSIVSVTDMAGRELYRTTVSMTIGAGSNQLDLSAIADGLYIISVKSGCINYNSTISISK